MDKQSLNKLIEDVGYIRGCFDTTIPNLNKTLEEINTKISIQETRINVIENKQVGLIATLTLITTGIGVVVGFLSNWLASWLNK